MAHRLTVRILLLLPLALSACAAVSFQRETQTSGTFKSSGFAFTIFSLIVAGVWWLLGVRRGEAHART